MLKFFAYNAILKFPDNDPIMLRNGPINAHGIGNYSCQIFNKKVHEIDKKLRKIKNQLSIVVFEP